MSTSETQLGEVKALLPDKFYGFIKPPGVGAEFSFTVQTVWRRSMN